MDARDTSICHQVALECAIVSAEKFKVNLPSDKLIAVSNKYFSFIAENDKASKDEMIRRQAALKRAVIAIPVCNEEMKNSDDVITIARKFFKYF